MSSNNIDIQFSRRYECKYIISPLLVPSLREFLRPFTRPDRYPARWPGHRYPIYSLYLGAVYDGSDTVFLEVKSKINTVVRKRRARLDRTQARVLLLEGLNGWAARLDASLVSDIEHFAHHTALTSARPVVRV